MQNNTAQVGELEDNVEVLKEDRDICIISKSELTFSKPVNTPLVNTHTEKKKWYQNT